MYHLRLIKGLSYSGAVSATKANPDVYTDDEVKYQRAMESGYFADITGCEDDDMKIYEPHGSSGEEKEKPAEEIPKEDPLDTMSATELRAYATVNGIDIGNKKRREDVLKMIKAAEESADEARQALVEA